MRHIVTMMAFGMASMVSGAGESSAPDAVATRIEMLLQGKYEDDAGLDRVARVLEIEKRLGAYRAAENTAEFMRRINADLRVATRDEHVCVREQTAPSAANTREYDLGMGLKLVFPQASGAPAHRRPDVR
ncbi:hypothetical protein [Dyella silvae]|uniref:hypothetical protein n=1 Tax=Dyella silvae TaxID=2994424 RepID=UPI002265155C|nr:hypothetical protein [Dyella silvae]